MQSEKKPSDANTQKGKSFICQMEIAMLAEIISAVGNRLFTYSEGTVALSTAIKVSALFISRLQFSGI